MEEDKDPEAMVATLTRRIGVSESELEAELPSFYFNSVELGISLSDVSIIVLLDGVRKSRLHMSYTTAKTLMRGLQQLFADFERASDHSIMTMAETDAALTSLQQEATPKADE